MPLWVFLVYMGLLAYMIVFNYRLFHEGDWIPGGILTFLLLTVVLRAAIGARR